MAVDRLGNTLAIGDDVLVIGRMAHDDSGNSRIVVDVHGQPITIDTARTLKASALALSRASAREMAAQLGVWWTVAQSSVALSVGATTAETTLASITIPGGALGANGRFRVVTFWGMSNNANNKTFRVRYSGAGGSALVSQTFTTQVYYRDEREVGNQNSASSQVWHAGFSVFGTGTAAIGTSTVNTGSDSTVAITGQKANSGDTLSLRSYRVELLYAA